jgi:hypothetical protein
VAGKEVLDIKVVVVELGVEEGEIVGEPVWPFCFCVFSDLLHTRVLIMISHVLSCLFVTCGR